MELSSSNINSLYSSRKRVTPVQAQIHYETSKSYNHSDERLLSEGQMFGEEE
jgi:hypothetical protein